MKTQPPSGTYLHEGNSFRRKKKILLPFHKILKEEDDVQFRIKLTKPTGMDSSCKLNEMKWCVQNEEFWEKKIS